MLRFRRMVRYLLTGCDDNTAQLWNIKTGEVVQQFVGHTDPVQAVAFSQDGQNVVTGSQDQTARLWDVKTGETVRQFVGHAGPIINIGLSNDGERLITGDVDKTYLWQTRLDEIVTLACDKISNDLTAEERALYQIP